VITVNNETLTAWCAAHPDRFLGFASVALQFPDLAVQQLEHAINPTATSIFDMSAATRYAPPAYPAYHQEAP
jgi:aminocarboxymuconate-semialdehyde decarboxylase